MKAWVYIIRSETCGRYYCGQSTNVEQRLRQHNDPEYCLSKTTKRFQGPWVLVWEQPCQDLSEARRLERRVKKRGIARFLREVKSVESREGEPVLTGSQ
ncbi:MAG: GIY-YIG nuclease family protein [Thermodesulfobacteriota bacterium]